MAKRGKTDTLATGMSPATRGAKPPAAAQKALGAACRAADLKALRAALRAGADPDRVARGWGPVHALIQETVHGEGQDDEAERCACLVALIDAGADIAIRAGFPPAPPLVLAGLGGKRLQAEILIERGAALDEFALAALGRRAPLLRRLAPSPELVRARDPGDLTLLHLACGSRMGRGDAKLAKELLTLVHGLVERGADVNALARIHCHGTDDFAPSYFAISAGRFDEARILLEHGADATTALVTAMWNTKDDFARFGALCLEHGARPDAAVHEGKPLVNQLVRWGQFKPATWLLEHGADANLPDERGWTATHQAASRGNARFWTTILAHGGDPDRPDPAGLTPAKLARAKKLAVR
jgi:hypothetical protein